MKSRTRIRWYVWPKSPGVNRIISQNLPQESGTSVQESLKVYGEEDPKNLWEVPDWNFICQLRKLTNAFRIYRQEGLDDDIVGFPVPAKTAQAKS